MRACARHMRARDPLVCATLSEAAAHSLVAKRPRGTDEVAYASARLRLAPPAQGEADCSLSLPVSVSADGRVDGAGAPALWGSPDPHRLVGALERLGFDAECWARPGGEGAEQEVEGAEAEWEVEVRLLGQYAGAKLVLRARSSEVLVDGRLGIDAGAALVARRTLRQVVLSELLVS
ncbi:hypothetical protein T492DRAFT_843938 [Pavlovales sp. CCMP2436]|nr:hypothetical protein T492DRAFT_843938 [Pavlovales sp. CCMP2436]